MRRSILGIFAHPDDETTVGPLVARYAQSGNDVYLVSITSGQKGIRPHANVPAGPELGRMREDELRCAARALGAHEPFLLGCEDQGIAPTSVSEHVLVKLREIIEETLADVVLTFGPDGLTGHPDHRIACDLATVAFQEQGRLRHKPRKLYYVAFPESRLAGSPDPLNRRRPFYMVSDAFLTTVLDCRAWLPAALAAIECHKTQWSPQRMLEIKGVYTRLLDGCVYLRLALSTAPAATRETCILEGLD